MKLIVILPDGLADRPQDDLNGQTPLAAAPTPTLDALAAAGTVARSRVLPDGASVDTSVALMAILGVGEPNLTGRGYYEALDRGLTLTDSMWAARCQLVTTDGDTIVDPNGGKTSTSESRQLMQLLDEKVGIAGVRFHFGNRANHLVTGEGEFPTEAAALPGPWEVRGKPFSEYLPGPESITGKLIARTREVLNAADVNVTRRELDEAEANMAYVYGAGRPVDYPSVEKTLGPCAMISYSPMARGMALAVKVGTVMTPIEAGVGWEELRHLALDAKKALATADVVLVHVSVPTTYADSGKTGPAAKVEGISRIDEHLIAPLVKHAQEIGDTRVAILPTVVSDSKTRQHLPDPVPVLVWGPGVGKSGATQYTEAEAAASPRDIAADETGLINPLAKLQ